MASVSSSCPRGQRGRPGPCSTETIGDEDLYRVPGAAPATLAATTPVAGPATTGLPVTVTHPDPSTWKMVVRAAAPEELRLRLTDVPGWRATLDGHPLALQRFAGIMLQARIPAGSHTVEVQYWPRSFSLGIVLAAVSVIGLAAASIVGWRRRRSRAAAGSIGLTV